jgi:hypothetical protein
MSSQPAVTRRRLLAVSTAAGLGGTLLPGVLLAMASEPVGAQMAVNGRDTTQFKAITPEMIEQAGVIAGVSFTEEQRKVMVEGLTCATTWLQCASWTCRTRSRRVWYLTRCRVV